MSDPKKEEKAKEGDLSEGAEPSETTKPIEGEGIDTASAGSAVKDAYRST
jgi:hypothetical protein